MDWEREIEGAEREIRHLEAERDRLRKALRDIERYVDAERVAAHWTVVKSKAQEGLRRG